MEAPQRRGRGAPLSSINITPLVDVMLVLLIIFMVTASLGQQGIPVKLPRATAAPLDVAEDTLTVSIDAQKRVFINQEQVAPDALGVRMRELVASRTDRTVFVKSDKDVPYGDFIQVVAAVKASGVDKLGMLTDLPHN